jgi:hypothetical protein
MGGIIPGLLAQISENFIDVFNENTQNKSYAKDFF